MSYISSLFVLVPLFVRVRLDQYLSLCSHFISLSPLVLELFIAEVEFRGEKLVLFMNHHVFPLFCLFVLLQILSVFFFLFFLSLFSLSFFLSQSHDVILLIM